MFCIKCGKEIQPTDKFCPYCGSPCDSAGQAEPSQVSLKKPEPIKPEPPEPSEPPKPEKNARKKGPNIALICIILAVVLAAVGVGGVFFVRSGNQAKLWDAAANSVKGKQTAQIEEIFGDYFGEYAVEVDYENVKMKGSDLSVPAAVIPQNGGTPCDITMTAQVSTNFLLTEYSIQPDIKLEYEPPYTVEPLDFAGTFISVDNPLASLAIEVSSADLTINSQSVGVPELVRNQVQFSDAGQTTTLNYIPAAFSPHNADTIYQTIGENGAPTVYTRSNEITGFPAPSGSEDHPGYTQLDYSWVEGSYLKSGSSSTVLSLQFDSWNPWETETRWYVRFTVTEDGIVSGSGSAYYSGGDSLPRLDGALTYSGSPITLKYDGSGFAVTCAELALYDAMFYAGTPSSTPAYTSSTDYIIPDSNWRVLTDADVAGMTAQEVNYAKNEIYARHGRRFVSEELQAYFDSKSWYLGTVEPEDFTEGMLSEVEKQNATFLASVETWLKENN
ncbi:MAG: YARHG domain-containing protein [Oscillospiraceae bacterium]|nr:YARHG domain-containing protein [Oscillospiraceae bacterium]